MSEKTVYLILGLVFSATIAYGVFLGFNMGWEEFYGKISGEQAPGTVSVGDLGKNIATNSGKEDTKWEAVPPPRLKIPEGEIVYYYGEECPYCKKFWAYVTENSIQEKIPFEKKEVWGDPTNSQEMILKAKACGYAEDEIGVPFLFTEEGCYMGEVEIRKFFENLLGR